MPFLNAFFHDAYAKSDDISSYFERRHPTNNSMLHLLRRISYTVYDIRYMTPTQ